ncbi:MAG: ECF-type sigma factor [Erythrobacter sp.]
MAKSEDITGLLQDFGPEGDNVDEGLAELVYDELRRRAANLFRGEGAGRTLQATGLVHEAWTKLADANIAWNDRKHFYAVATRMMKRLLINEANARKAAKRGGDQIRVTLGDDAGGTDSDRDLLELNEALQSLAKVAPRKAELIELHYFGGLTAEQIVEVSGLSTATITRDLRFARAWLKDELDKDYG